jgi:SAM-dependent methyltransferase
LSIGAAAPECCTAVQEAQIREAIADVDGFVPTTDHAAEYVRHRERYLSDACLVLAHRGTGPVLEVGSAPCHMTAVLAAAGVPVVGVDIAPDRARAMIERYALDIRRCDVERAALPFAEGTFETILFAETLEHLRVDPLFALSEINRVLAPGGRLLLTTPNLYSAQNIARFLAGRGITDALEEFSKLRRLGHMGHVREYTRAEVRRLLDAHGFRILARDCRHYHYPRSKRGLLARAVFAVLPRRLRTYQVVVAEKVREGPRLAPLE